MDTKRKHLRFTCNGSADLTNATNGRVWGHLGDICLGGFYLSTFGPWPVNTEVHFKADVEGREISGKGVVTTCHPGVGMAIVFQDLSPEDHKVLEEVIANLEHSGTGESSLGLQL
jgi:PilZ domain-containing protein